MTRKRLRLTLGPRQAERLLLALSYAIDTFSADDEDEQINAFERRQIAEWDSLREVIRREVSRQGVRLWR